MDKNELVLAALATGEGAAFSPVQVQKLMFVLDREISQHTGGPHFAFEPYDYGPFDAAVYSTLEGLQAAGDVEISYGQGTRRRSYRLTVAGQTKGRELLASTPPEVREYMRQLSGWVRSLSFTDLVSAIYAAYPEMRANSVFRG